MLGCGANPARAFGPAVATRTFNGYHWIYWLGPYMGAGISAFFYWVNKKLKFEHVNPGQDDDPSTRAEMNRVLDERLGEGNMATNIVNQLKMDKDSRTNANHNKHKQSKLIRKHDNKEANTDHMA